MTGDGNISRQVVYLNNSDAPALTQRWRHQCRRGVHPQHHSALPQPWAVPRAGQPPRQQERPKRRPPRAWASRPAAPTCAGCAGSRWLWSRRITSPVCVVLAVPPLQAPAVCRLPLRLHLARPPSLPGRRAMNEGWRCGAVQASALRSRPTQHPGPRPPPHPACRAARCTRCGSVALHSDCVAEALSKSLRAEWTSSRGSLGTMMVRGARARAACAWSVGASPDATQKFKARPADPAEAIPGERAGPAGAQPPRAALLRLPGCAALFGRGGRAARLHLLHRCRALPGCLPAFLACPTLPAVLAPSVSLTPLTAPGLQMECLKKRSCSARHAN